MMNPDEFTFSLGKDGTKKKSVHRHPRGADSAGGPKLNTQRAPPGAPAACGAVPSPAATTNLQWPMQQSGSAFCRPPDTPSSNDEAARGGSVLQGATGWACLSTYPPLHNPHHQNAHHPYYPAYQYVHHHSGPPHHPTVHWQSGPYVQPPPADVGAKSKENLMKKAESLVGSKLDEKKNPNHFKKATPIIIDMTLDEMDNCSSIGTPNALCTESIDMDESPEEDKNSFAYKAVMRARRSKLRENPKPQSDGLRCAEEIMAIICAVDIGVQKKLEKTKYKSPSTEMHRTLYLHLYKVVRDGFWPTDYTLDWGGEKCALRISGKSVPTNDDDGKKHVASHLAAYLTQLKMRKMGEEITDGVDNYKVTLQGEGNVYLDPALKFLQSFFDMDHEAFSKYFMDEEDIGAVHFQEYVEKYEFANDLKSASYGNRYSIMEEGKKSATKEKIFQEFRKSTAFQDQCAVDGEFVLPDIGTCAPFSQAASAAELIEKVSARSHERELRTLDASSKAQEQSHEREMASQKASQEREKATFDLVQQLLQRDEKEREERFKQQEADRKNLAILTEAFHRHVTLSQPARTRARSEFELTDPAVKKDDANEPPAADEGKFSPTHKRRRH